MKRVINLLCLLILVPVVVAQTVTVNTNGGDLAVSIGENLDVTRLVVKGALDARDFDYIYNKLDKLREVDLSNCTVVAYNSNDKQYLGYHTHFEEHTIPPSAFFGKITLERIILPESITTIAEGAFAGCSNLVAVEGNFSVTHINDFAFQECSRLSDIKPLLSPSLMYIGEYAFEKCGVIQIDLTSCTSLSHIGTRTFANNKNLQIIKFPQKLSYIGDAVVAGCIALDKVQLPRYATQWGIGMMAGCIALENIDLTDVDMQRLPAWIFSGCTQLVDVALPATLKTIEEGTFCYCSSLSRITLPANVVHLNAFAFAGCSALQRIDFLPMGVEQIGKYAFYHNTAADSVKIPASVAYIDDHAFDGCKQATIFESPREIPAELGEEVFSNMNVSHKSLIVDEKSILAYKSALQWQDFGQIGTASVEDVTSKSDINAWFSQYNLVVTASLPITSIRLYDTSGMQLVYLTPNNNEVNIATQNFSSNIYIIQVTTQDGRCAIAKVARVMR